MAETTANTDWPMTAALACTEREIATDAVICEIETEGTRIGPGADRRWDITAMFNPNEHAPESIDRAERDVGWAIGCGLLALESGRPVVVRILKRLAP